MNRHSGLCLSIFLGSTLMAGCTGTMTPVIYGEQQQGANGQRLLVPLATAHQVPMTRDNNSASTQMSPEAPAQSLVSIAPQTVPFLSPAPIRLVASETGAIEIHHDAVGVMSGTMTLTGAQAFGDLSPVLQALLFPSCSTERLLAALPTRR